MLLARVNDEHRVGQSVHSLDTAVVSFEVVHLLDERSDFLFRKEIEGSVLLHFFERDETVYRLLDGLEVGEHTARPSFINKVHTRTLGLVLDSVRRLLLGAYKKERSLVGDKVADKHISLIELLYSLLKVDDVETVSLGEDVFSHLRVPSSGVVSEMNTGFKQLLKCNNRHIVLLSFSHRASHRLNGIRNRSRLLRVTRRVL